MIVVGILLFIVIMSISSLRNRRKREAAEIELEEARKENRRAIAKLHRLTSH